MSLDLPCHLIRLGGLDSLKGHRAACAEPGLPRACRRAEVSREKLAEVSRDALDKLYESSKLLIALTEAKFIKLNIIQFRFISLKAVISCFKTFK